MTALRKRRTIRSVQAFLLAGGSLLLGYCGLTLSNSWIFEHRASRELAAVSQETGKALPAKNFQGLVGRLEIPRLDVSVIVMEGSTDSVLRRAAGHIEGTALPGETGNVGISAHRDTFFRPLRNIRANDAITITTPHGAFRYRVVSTRIVLPTDVSVLDGGRREILTLVTCYPFYFIGAAPDRFIVRAERVL